MISIFMILGVLLITRPPAIFGQDAVSQTDARMNETLNCQNMTQNNNQSNCHFPNVTVLTDNKKPHTEGYEFLITPYNFFIPFSGEFHPTFQEHLNKDEKKNQTDFSSAQKIGGYIACITVPFLSALISLITKQCNNQKVPIYILMLWFGVGASCVIIFGMISNT